METKSTKVTMIFTLEVEFTEHYQVDKRTEECHGYHQFEDYNTLGFDLNSAIIKTDDETIIDITDRLTKDEIKKLTPED
jgi:hypothetical protein